MLPRVCLVSLLPTEVVKKRTFHHLMRSSKLPCAWSGLAECIYVWVCTNITLETRGCIPPILKCQTFTSRWAIDQVTCGFNYLCSVGRVAVRSQPCSTSSLQQARWPLDDAKWRADWSSEPRLSSTLHPCLLKAKGKKNSIQMFEECA